MRFELSDSFRNFFSKNHLIEFEEILSLDEADLLSSKIDALLPSALGKTPLQCASNKELWAAGRDQWKQDPEIKKILLKSRIGEIASFLFKRKQIRFAYTQSIVTGSLQDLPFAENHTLAEISSMDPILGGVFLSLNSPDESFEEEILPDFRKQKKGRALFFSATQPIPFPELFRQKGQKTLLICFTEQRVRYKMQPLDVHTHALKKLGYTFGDLILEAEAPYLQH